MTDAFFINLEKQLWQALTAGDKTGFAALLADDVALVAVDGVRRNKTEYLARMPQFTIGPSQQYNFHVVHLNNAASVVNYTAEISGTSNGQPLAAKLCISSTWCKRGDAWQIVFTQDALLARPL